MYGIYENNQVIAKFVAPTTLRSNQPMTVSDTLSLKRQISRRSAQRWEITSNLEPLSDDAEDLFVNLVTKGFSETVSITVPQNVGSVRKTTSTAISPKATGSANATQLTVIDNAGIIAKGTLIKFDNHSKIYMLTSDLSANGSLNIYPALRIAVNQTSFKFKKDVIMSCLYDTDTVMGMIYSDGILMDMGTVTLIEKL